MPKILLIDDDPFYSAFAAFVLGERYLVTRASSADEGLAICENGFDLVIIDLRLPAGKHSAGCHLFVGLAVAHDIRQRCPTVKLLLHSAAYSQLGSSGAGALEGASFAVKTPDPPKLLELVESILGA